MKMLTKALLIAAAALGSLLAGVSANRIIVADHAWALTGVDRWAAYTRAADLGRAKLWYPLIGLSALACCLLAAVADRLDRKRDRSAAIPIYGAALMAIAALVVTVTAVVPPTLGVLAPGVSMDVLRGALSTVSRWWVAKGTLHILTFGANLWALAAVSTSTDDTRLLVWGTLFAGLLSGGNIDRAFFQMPAWRVLGPVHWADFSRHADLGNGFFLYPIEAFGALALLAGALIAWRRRPSSRAAGIALWTAVALAIGGLLMTIKAAPQMISIRALPDTNIAGLQHAFDQFDLFGNIRGAFQVGSFFAGLAALVLGDGRFA